MKASRILLSLGALLLLLTAAFHATGASAVAGWVTGDRAQVIEALWFVPAIDWTVVAMVWAFVAWRADAKLGALVWITAIIPLAVAVMLIATAGAGFAGIWMLVSAAALAMIGSAGLR